MTKLFIFLFLFLYTNLFAQFGTIGIQPDTNRFVSGINKYGLVMPHQKLIQGNLDTVITSAGTNGGNGSYVIVGSLLNPDDNCVGAIVLNDRIDCSGSYAAWRKYEKETGWYQASRGDTSATFPTNYAITVSTGLDSVVIWNRDTAELWMAFGGPEALGLVSSTATTKQVSFKDGRLFITSSAWWNIIEVDFLTDKVIQWAPSGLYRITPSDIQSRNEAHTNILLNGNLTYSGQSNNSITTTRDGFGLMDGSGLGRIAQWWGTTSNTGSSNESVYNPHARAVYDGSQPPTENMKFNKYGQVAWTLIQGGSGDDYIFYRDTIFNIVEEPFYFEPNFAGPSGWAGRNNRLNYGQGVTNFTNIAWGKRYPDLRNRSEFLFGFSSAATNGVYRITPAIGLTRDAANMSVNSYYNMQKQFMSDVNTPIDFGASVLVLPFEDNTTDYSPYGKTMGVAGAPGTITAVFGNGYSGCYDCSLTSGPDSDYNIQANPYPFFTISMWIKSGTETCCSNTLERLMTMWDNLPSASYYLYIQFNTSGNLIFQTTNIVTDTITTTGDFYDGKWHHIALVQDEWGIRGYVDGIEVGSDGLDHGSFTGLSHLWIGDPGGEQGFNGIIDDFVFTKSALSSETIKRIHAEGRKKLNMGTPSIAGRSSDALHSSDVDYVDALESGFWLAGNQDSLTIFDGRIPIKTYGTPGGNIQSAALFETPGAEELGLVIATTEKLQFIQPNIDIEKYFMSTLYDKEPVYISGDVVVDSAGTNGMFLDVGHAIKAVGYSNAATTHLKVKIAPGGYRGFDVPQINRGGQIFTALEISGYNGGTPYPSSHGSTTRAPYTRIGSDTYTQSGITGNVPFGSYFTLKNMYITNDKGGGAGEASCINFNKTPSTTSNGFVTLENIHMTNCDNYGIDFAGSWANFYNVSVNQVDQVGMLIRGDSNQEGHFIRGGIINANADGGLIIAGDHGVVSGVRMRNNTGAYADFQLQSLSDGWLIENNLYESGSNLGTNNTITDNNTTPW